MGPPASSSDEIAVGRVLAGRYRIEGVVKRGGMGIVVAARHLELGQRVAIKVLTHASAARQDGRQRFLREARAAAFLRSEHVVRVSDAGTLPGGSPFMVMELLEGMDLEELVATRGPLPIDAAVEHLLQACEGLAEAHAAGIVHRDLKPSNLFHTERPDGSPLLKIVDFGISKSLEEADGSEGVTTATDAVFGSPLYMSPEQMKSAKSVDARADVWSLGVVLHYLLTARRAFDADSIAGICMAVTTQPPRPLSADRPDAPEALEEVLRRCLEKDRERRFADLADLAEALAPFCARAGAHVERTRLALKGPRPRPEDDGQAPRTRVTVAGAQTTDGFAPTTLAAPQAIRRPMRRAVLASGAGLVAAGLAALAVLRATAGPSAALTGADPSGEATVSLGPPPLGLPPPALASPPLDVPPPGPEGVIAADPRPSVAPRASAVSRPIPAPIAPGPRPSITGPSTGASPGDAARMNSEYSNVRQ